MQEQTIDTTDREQVFQKVREILIELFQFPPEKLTLETNLFTDLDLDSLDAIDLAAELGTRTRIRFSNDDLRKIRTIDDVVQAIIQKTLGDSA